jgi:Peptidase C39 family
MSTGLPHYRQEKKNTCALACLRMVLASFGSYVEEGVLQGKAHMETDGTAIGELERLARQFGLVADIEEATVEQLRDLLAEGKLPIVYIDRAIFELSPRQRAQHSIRDAVIHTVVTTQITARFVTYHDPRQARVTRKTTVLFRQAYEALGGHCVVCFKPEKA